MPIPPLTRSIGSAERALRALLERELSSEHLSFAQWTALVFSSAAPLSTAELAERQLAGHVVSSESETNQAIDGLLGCGALTLAPDGLLHHTEKGRGIFSKLSKSIEHITSNLFESLPQADLEATHRTLLAVADRAGRLLASK